MRPRRAPDSPGARLALGRARYLVDTSALARADKPAVHERLEPLLLRGQLAVDGVVFLELLFSARPGRVDDKRVEIGTSFIVLETLPGDIARAAGVMIALDRQGRHRSVGIADLLVAACAERNGLVLLHYDADFDHIASVTGQAADWVVQRGSIS